MTTYKLTPPYKQGKDKDGQYFYCVDIEEHVKGLGVTRKTTIALDFMKEILNNVGFSEPYKEVN